MNALSNSLRIASGQLVQLTDQCGIAVLSQWSDGGDVCLLLANLVDNSGTPCWYKIGQKLEIAGCTWQLDHAIGGAQSPDEWVLVLNRVPSQVPSQVPILAPLVAERSTAEPESIADYQAWKPVKLVPFGGLTETGLVKVEQEFHVQLSPDYRRWLLETNGGLLKATATIAGGPFVITPQQPFFGIHSPRSGRDLRTAQKLRPDYLPGIMTVIAEVTGGLIVVFNGAWGNRLAFLSKNAIMDAERFPPHLSERRTEYLLASMVVLAENIYSFLAALRPVSWNA